MTLPLLVRAPYATVFAIDIPNVEKIAIHQWRQANYNNMSGAVVVNNFHLTPMFLGQTQ